MPTPSSSQAADIVHDRGRCAEQGEPRGENDVRGAEHLPSADAVDLAPDPRAEQSGDHQRRRERREEPVASRCRGRARSDRPGWPADSSSIPTPASGRCRAPRRRRAVIDPPAFSLYPSCRHFAGIALFVSPARAQRSASGPIEIPAARTMKASIHPAALCGPPAKSSATPVPQAPAAESPKPTVE